MTYLNFVPDAEPYYLPGGPIGCLLIHGFTSSPEESRPLGEDLHQLGYTILGLRLAGHGTHPDDLKRVRAEDWLANVEDGISLLTGNCQNIILIGQSLGGCLALISAARFPIAGVVAISTPYPPDISFFERVIRSLTWALRPTFKKKGPKPHPSLGIRREAEYPAYTQYPSRVLRELFRSQEMMGEEIDQVEVPVLLIQSRDDPFIPPQDPPRLLKGLPAEQKQLIWLEGLGHSLTNHPGRADVVQSIDRFLKNLILPLGS